MLPKDNTHFKKYTKRSGAPTHFPSNLWMLCPRGRRGRGKMSKFIIFANFHGISIPHCC